jgi:hypothetical protein
MNLNIDIYSNISEFLNPSDIKNLLKTSKFLNKNVEFKKYTRELIFNKSANIVISFWRKYVVICKAYLNISFLTKKYVSFYFFKYLDKEHINNWYNINIGWKKKIIDKYKIKKTETPTRLDLYILIKKIPVEDVLSIGW